MTTKSEASYARLKCCFSRKRQREKERERERERERLQLQMLFEAEITFSL